MNLRKFSPDVAASPQLIDELVDAYVRWREESATASAAYENWRGADRDERRLAHAAYVAALDREELAAREYQRVVEHVANASPGVRVRARRVGYDAA